MRRGKVSQAVLERSVLRTIKSENNKLLKKSQIGGDVSLVSSAGSCAAALSTKSVVIRNIYDLIKINSCFAHLINHIACGNSIPVSVMVSIVLPENIEENLLKEMMKTIDNMCLQNKMQIAGGHTDVSSDVEYTVLTLTCVGDYALEQYKNTCARPKQDIVITKYIAMEGTAFAADKYREKLSDKLPSHIIETAVNFFDDIVAVGDALISYKNGASAIHDVGEGGIFAALWEFAYASNVGITVDIKKIPIRQETVEICEILNVNPYEFMSTGALVMAADNGEALCEILRNNNIPAVVVGRTTDSNDRIIVNEDERRYLVPAAQDNIYRI